MSERAERWVSGWHPALKALQSSLLGASCIPLICSSPSPSPSLPALPCALPRARQPLKVQVLKRVFARMLFAVQFLNQYDTDAAAALLAAETAATSALNAYMAVNGTVLSALSTVRLSTHRSHALFPLPHPAGSTARASRTGMTT